MTQMQTEANTVGMEQVCLLSFILCLAGKLESDAKNVTSLMSLHHYRVLLRGSSFSIVDTWGWGDLQKRGLVQNCGCGLLITQQRLMAFGLPLLENTICSRSNASPLQILLVMI